MNDSQELEAIAEGILNETGGEGRVPFFTATAIRGSVAGLVPVPALHDGTLIDMRERAAGGVGQARAVVESDGATLSLRHAGVGYADDSA